MKTNIKIVIILIFMIIANVVLLNISYAQSLNKGQELPSKRTLNSKTYFNHTNNLVTTVVNSGYLHYQDEEGTLHEINRNIVGNKDGPGFKVTRGLYHAYFAKNYTDMKYPVVFETDDNARFSSKLTGLAYYSKADNRLVMVQNVQSSYGEVEGNKIYYREAFSSVDVEYEYIDTRLKQQVHLSQSARDNLPDPKKLGLKSNAILLVLITEFEVSEDVNPYANNVLISSRGQGKGLNMDFEGENAIRFKNNNGLEKFMLMEDIAIAPKNHGNSGKQGYITHPMWRRFYASGDKNYMMTGISYNWIMTQDKGDIILDPTIAVFSSNNRDTYITAGAPNANQSSEQYLLIGNDGSKKRAMIQFTVEDAIPISATISSAKLKLYFHDVSPSGSAIARNIKCNSILKIWYETMTSWNHQVMMELPWNESGVGRDDVDAKTEAEASIIWNDNIDQWMEYDITDLAQKWVNHTIEQNGVLLWADNDDVVGDVKRIYSSNYNTDPSKRPSLELEYELGPLAEYEYDEMGRPVEVIYANGVIESNKYDRKRGWLLKREYNKGYQTLFKFDTHPHEGHYLKTNYPKGYDKVGNMLYVKYNHKSTISYFMEYQYDNYNRISNFQHSAGVSK